MRRLSSRWTILPKYIVPVLTALLMVFSAWKAGVWWESLFYIVLFGAASVYAIAFAADFCRAETDGEILALRSARRSARVPLSEIKEVAAFTNSKWPHIDVVFRRPTALGNSVRIMPRKDFWATYDLLAQHADLKRHDVDDDAQHRTVRGARAPLVMAVALVLCALIVGIVAVIT